MWALVALVVFTSYTLVINILLCLFISNIFYIYSMKKMVQTVWVLQGITFFYVMCLSYVLVIQSCLTLCDPMDCCPPGSSVYGILQAWILKWVAISSSRGFSPPRDWTRVSWVAGRFFTIWATREALIHFEFTKEHHCCLFLVSPACTYK